MYTGLVEEIGVVLEVSTHQDTTNSNDSKYRKFRIWASTIMKDLKIGDSISINGACQTVVNKSSAWNKLVKGSQWFEVESQDMTLTKTNFLLLKKGSYVNLERALTFSSRLGGHLVNGHVQTVASISKIEKREKNTYLYITLPEEISPYAVPEGSITIDGISVTIAKIEGNVIIANIIPHTLSNTTIQYFKVDDVVNIETDMLIQYAYTILQPSLKNALSL